jgi:hypothetical protein
VLPIEVDEIALAGKLVEAKLLTADKIEDRDAISKAVERLLDKYFVRGNLNDHDG